MENTSNIDPFKDKNPHWYIARGANWVGPLTAMEVYQRVLDQEISWAHFVWKPGQKEWQRICDIKIFQAVVPATPSPSLQTEVSVASTSAEPVVRMAKLRSQSRSKEVLNDWSWFLYYQNSQFGPYSQEEIERYIRVGKIHGRTYIWREGMAKWERLEKIEEFKALLASVSPPLANVQAGDPDFDTSKTHKTTTRSGVALETRPGVRQDKRKAPRRPLVAKIIITEGKTVDIKTAMCRDISIGGMQMLTDQIPGIVGTSIKVNVSTIGKKGPEFITPFVAEGVIVRILEDKRGFSFRFTKISENARRTIENYIATSN